MQTITFEYENADGDEDTGELPAKYEVCSRCDGTGTHVNEAIDGHGITADEWNGPDWDDDSRETYMRGGYDVQCTVCHGLRVVLEVDEDAVEHGSPELRAIYQAYLDVQCSIAESEAEAAAERRLGA